MFSKYEKWPDVECFAYAQGDTSMSQMADERSYDIAIFAILVKFLT